MNILSRLVRRIRLLLLRHEIYGEVSNKDNRLLRLGTEYGGWTFVESSSLMGCTVLSAGAGEDVSFDVEFVARFGARVILIDPTPRAIDHYHSIKERFGCAPTFGYEEGGKQSAQSYDLTNLTRDNLVMVPVALADHTGEAEFHLPVNPDNVSHSLKPAMHGISAENKISVRTMTLPDLVASVSLTSDSIEILKLDIEGSELDVISALCASDIRPNQILVEYDELNYPTRQGNEGVRQAHNKLRAAGYTLCATDGKADFTYVLTERN